jgi:hypothetical protein
MKKLYRCPVKGESPLNFIKAKTLYINDIKGCSAPLLGLEPGLL